jgi:hypothetical protein
MVPGRLHHRTRHLLGDQVIAQRQDPVRRRPPGRHHLHRPPPTRTRDPHTDRGVPLRDTDPGAPGMNQLHNLTFHNQSPFRRLRRVAQTSGVAFSGDTEHLGNSRFLR